MSDHYCLTIIVVANLWLGQPRASIEEAQAAYRISQEIDNPWGQIHSGSVLAFGFTEIGEYEQALHIAQRCREVGNPHELVLVRLIHLLVLGGVYRALLIPDRARVVHLEALELQQKS